MAENHSPDTILQNALEIADVEVRAAYFDEACGEDRALRHEVESLLAAHLAAADTFMGTLADRGWEEELTEKEGDTIGRYKLLQEIGEGGGGTVYMADQTEPVKRRVALKVIKLGMDTRQVVARFEAERQALALMDHPNIAKVLDAGATEGGRPYFVMELVKGVPITKFCDENKLSTKERLELFIQVCEAVQHAHQKGIIHRDLKPGNILVTMMEDRAMPKVIDFGIAKATQQELTEKTLFTQHGHIIGTPAYMSPEQASLTGYDIDTRSDIYALGVVLYELLCGNTPFDPTELLKAGYDEIRRVIAEDEPSKPSTRLSSLGDGELTTLATHRDTGPRRLSKLMRGDLDWVVMKALEKDRRRRYETANGFAMDVRRFLDQEPVTAGPPGFAYKMRKFVRRNKAAFAAAAAIAAALLVGTVVSLTFAVRAEREKQAAQFNEGLGWILRAEVAEKEGNRYPDTLLYAARAIGFDGLGRPDGDLPELPRLIRKERNPREYETARDWIRNRPNYLSVWSSGVSGAPSPITDLTISAAGRWLAGRAADGSVRLWDFSTAKPMEIASGSDSPANAIAFHPGNELLAVAEADRVRFWNLEKRAFVEQAHERSVSALAYSASAKRLAGADADGSIYLWDGGDIDASLLKAGETTPASGLTFSRDDSLLAAVSPGASLNLFLFLEGGNPQLLRGWAEWAQRHPAAAEQVNTVAFPPNGAILAIGSRNGAMSLWDVARAVLLGEVTPTQRHAGSVNDLVFSQDGEQLASASADGTIKLWSLEGNQPVVHATLNGHGAEVTKVAYVPGGTLLASGGSDGSVKLWDVSGLGVEDPELYRLLAENWCAFDPSTGKVNWQAGQGFLNLPADSVVDIWRRSDEAGKGLFNRLMEGKDWAGAELVAGPDNENDRQRLADALLSDAEEAATNQHWNSARRHLRQWSRLGADVAGEERAAEIRKGIPAGDESGFTNGEGIDMVWCPKGRFLMGSPADERGHQQDEPQREVELTPGFWIAKYELTRAQYQSLMGLDNTNNLITSPTMPTVGLNWDEAMEVCRVLTAREQVRGTVLTDWEYTLPTEAQWEYACRAGTETAYSFGDDERFLRDYARYIGSGDGRSGRVYPVGTKKPNPWGIHDMHGNVWEWCLNDAWGQRLPSQAYRGGSFGSSAGDLRSARRRTRPSTDRAGDLGLRLALVPAGPSVKRERNTARRMGKLRANMQTLLQMLEDPDADPATLRESRRMAAYFAIKDEDWDVAREHLEALIFAKEKTQEDYRLPTGDWMRLAALHLKTRNNEAFEDLSKKMVTMFEDYDKWGIQERVAKTYCASPLPPAVEAERVGEMARRGSKRAPRPRSVRWMAVARGMAEYRLGNFEEAGKHLEFAAGSRFQMCRVLARAYHTMAAHQLGQTEYATWLLATATEEMMPLSADDPAVFWYDEIFAKVALKEASELIAENQARILPGERVGSDRQ